MSLRADVRLAPRFRSEPGPPRRLVADDGRRLLVDGRVQALYQAAAHASVGETVRQDPEPALAYAALSVLVQAGALAPDGVPGGEPRPAPSLPAEPPLVSLVVVAFNSADDLPALLASIATQGYPRLEAIVVDNGSTDGSADLVERDWPGVTVLRQAVNGGFGAGVNAGLAAARGEWVAVLNADLELDRDCVAAWVSRALEVPEAGAIAAKMMLASHPRFINSLGSSIVRSAWGSDNFMGVLDMGQFDGLTDTWGACFGAVLLSVTALGQVGPLDADYFLYYEDLDWCYRARLAGRRIVTAPLCRVRHQFGASVSRRHESFKVALVTRNRLRYVLLNMSAGVMARYLPRYVYMDLRQVAKALLTRNPLALKMYARIYLELLWGLPRILAGRRRRRRPFRLPPGAEVRALALNLTPSVAAHVGGEALLSWPVVQEWYLDLFPLPEELRQAAAAGSDTSVRRSGGGRRSEETARPS